MASEEAIDVELAVTSHASMSVRKTALTAGARAGWGTRVLYYLPNRALDLTDMVRARVRVGPGVHVGARVTDYLSFEAGRYRSFYFGFPGPRYPYRVVAPLGFECKRGLELCGVDATDEMKHEPHYSEAEISVGGQFLLVGGRIGVDLFEVADFFAGWVFLDPRGDDLEALRPAGVWERGRMTGLYRGGKPARFDSLHSRLGFVRTNLVCGLESELGAIDSRFAEEKSVPMQSTLSEMRLLLFMEAEYDRGVDLSFKPRLSLDVEFPNLEKRWRIFVSNSNLDELPGADPDERSTSPRLGVRRLFRRISIKADAGVKVRWLPAAFAALKWVPAWQVGQLHLLPQVKAYTESGDGFGQLNTLTVYRWFGRRHGGFFRSTSSVRWRSTTDAWDWEQTLLLARVKRLIDESRRGKSIGVKHGAKAVGLKLSAFGSLQAEERINRYRAALVFKVPVHSDWIYLEVAPEVNWREADDWEAIPQIRIGLDVIFAAEGYYAPRH